jgi:hypothetical protein
MDTRLVAMQRQEQMGVLVVRAFVEPGPGRRLLVQLIEVCAPGPDRVIGTVDSADAASRLVGDWLGSLERKGSVGGGTASPSANGDR